MPDRYGKISIHQSPVVPPDTPDAIPVQTAAPPIKKGKSAREKNRRPSPKKTVALYWLGALIGIFALYLAIGFLAIPRYLATSLPQEIKAATTFILDPGVITFNPLTFHFTISEARLSEEDGTPLASLGHLAADLAPVSLLRLDLVCNTVTLSELTLHLAREKDGSYNLSRTTPTTSGDGGGDMLDFSDLPFFFSLNNIVVREGKVLFSDGPTGKTHTIEKLHMELPSFSNIPFHSDEYLRPSFSAVINGSPVELTGQAFVGESGEGATTLTANLHGLDLPLYAEYLPSPLPLLFTGGKVDGTIDFIFDPASREEDKLVVDFKLQLADVECNTGKETLFVTAPLTEIAGRMKPLGRFLAFTTISAQKPAFHTFGTSLLESLDPLFAKDQAAAAAAPLAVSIESLQVEAGALHLWMEKGASKPITTWDGLGLQISGYSSTPVAEKSATEGGTFSLSGREVGSTAVFSWQGKLASSGSQVGEAVLSEYQLAELLNTLGVDVSLSVQGIGGLKGLLTVTPPGKAEEQLSFKIADAELSARDVKVMEGKQVVLEAPTLRCTSLGTALKTIHFGKVSVDNGSIVLHKGPLPSLLRSFSGGKYLLQELDFKGRLTVSGDSQKKKKPFATELTIAAKNLDTLEKARENLTLSAKTGTGATVVALGDVRLAPFSVNLNTTFSGLPAADILPLVSRSPLLAAMSGTLSGKGIFGLPKVGFDGDLTIAQGSLPIPAGPPLSWNNLVLQGIDYSSQPIHLGIVSADFEQPQFSWQLGKHEGGPLAQLAGFLHMHLPEPPPPAKDGEEVKTASSTVDLQGITFKDGSLLLQDPRLKPSWKGELTNLSGSIAAITSSHLDQSSPYSLTGKLQDTDITVDGTLKVFAKDDNGDYHLTLDRYPLANLQEQLAILSEVDSKGGYATLMLDGTPKDGQFHHSGTVTVGKVKATSYKSDSALALALLTNNDDTFALDFDVSGTAASGKTALLDEILALFQTKVVKAAVSPLLLASGDFSELIGNEFITFEPGQMILTENGNTILGRYAELLQSHPLLGIELSGGIDRDSDTPVLKEMLLARERQRVDEENRRRYQEWLQEKEIFDQKVAEHQKKVATKGKAGEAVPAPAVLREYIALQPKAVNVDNAMLLDLARKRVQLLLQLLTEQFAITAGRLTIEPLKKVPSQAEGQVGPAVKITLITTK